MSALSIQVPFPVFQDRDGQPLDNGYVWIGEPNLNPQTNPVVAYYDAALTIVAPQPLRTLNGYVSRAGTPAQIYVDGVNFSILVQDSKGSMVYNFSDGTGISPDACGVTYDPPFTGGVPYPVCEKLAQTVSVTDFGAVGDGVTDDTAAIQAAIDAADKINFPAGHFIITEPLIVPPQKELIGTGGTGKVNWTSNFADLAGQTVINKTTNTPDAQFGLDALLICSNGSPSPVAAETGSQVYPAGGDVIISNLCFIGNGVHGPGGSGSHNAFGIVAGSGQHTHISNVFMRRTGVSLYMHGTYLSSVDNFDTFGQIYQHSGTSTTYTGCEAGYGLYGGFRLSSVSYSTLQNCAVDAPLYSAYTLKDCKGVSLVSCGQEFIREDPLPASTRGMYLNFEGGNSVSVIAHRAFDNNPPISNPGYETSLISATTGDNISFVSDYIIIPLFPTITGLKYARLMNDARVEVSGGYGYLSDTFSGNFNIASTARYTIFDADATLVQMKGQLPSTQLPNTNGRGALWAVDSYQADTDLAVTIGGSSTGITYAWRKCSITRVNNKILVSMLIYMTATGGLTGTVKITGFPWEPPATYYSRAFTFVLFNPATVTPRIAYGVVGAGGVIDLFDSNGVALTQAIFPPAPVFTQFDAQFIIEIDPSTGP